MSLTFLPDWMPGWAILALAVPVVLWCLAFLMVPFSVIGVKARLENMEAQLDSLQEELRLMGMRATGALSASPRQLDPYDDVPQFNALKRGQVAAEPEPPRRAPIPTPQPTAHQPRERLTPLPPSVRPRREPRLD